MRTKSRFAATTPTPLLLRSWISQNKVGTESTVTIIDPPQLPVGDVDVHLNMAQVNGLFRDQSPQDSQRPASGRVISASMMRAVAISPSDSSAPAEPQVWSAAVGHASTGKSGRVIERLQGDIDRLHREKQLLKMRHEEVEKTNETLVTRNQYFQDRISNYEQSHEANLRQLARKERQVEELREELKKEQQRTTRAEEQAQIANVSEEQWKDQASHAKAVASQKEAEYETIVSCRNNDNDCYQGGLDKLKSSFGMLMRQREEDLEKQKKLEILAEQQKQTIGQLEELTKRLNANFKNYRSEIDTAIAGLRENASTNDIAITNKLDDMTKVTGEMRWVMKLEDLFNGAGQKHESNLAIIKPADTVEDLVRPETPRKVLGFEMKSKHRRRGSSKVSK